jgi:hypothetical protein
MALKDSFTVEEWSRLVSAPMVTAIAMTAADPGGLWSAVRESAAAAGAMRSAHGGSGLAAEVVGAYDAPEGRDLARGALKEQVKGKKPAEVVEAALAELAGVVAIVAAKSPAEAPAFKAWLREVARKVAEAGTEGGFLGFGGEKVSAEERATLARLDTALA